MTRTGAPEVAGSPNPATPGRIWLLLGDKPGDNAQVEAAVEALGWACERKMLQWRHPYATAKPRFRATLDHVDQARSAPLGPPWPDLVLTIGRRPSMAALWLKARSAGRTRIVLFGKPSGMMERFDLVVAGAEVQLPPGPNLVPIRLPLMRAKASDIEAAVARWRGRLAALPRPLIAILVGGPTVPFAFDVQVSERLCRLAAAIAGTGGTPYVTTSRRTPRAVVDALRAGLPEAAQLFEWTPARADNPYLALLGLADGFIVTGDSVSMMAEVARMRRPLAILELPLGRFGAIDQWRRTLMRGLFAADAGRLRRLVAAGAYRARLLHATRDFRAFHRMLFDQGLAVRAGEPLLPPRGALPDDLPRVVARINALIGVPKPEDRGAR
ncbi:MAG: mitochondrial fission ELM1 family protein [Geminicoccaceae bacterium]